MHWRMPLPEGSPLKIPRRFGLWREGLALLFSYETMVANRWREILNAPEFFSQTLFSLFHAKAPCVIYIKQGSS